MENATRTVLHNNKDRRECGNYRGVALVAYAGRILFKITARCLSEYGQGVVSTARARGPCLRNRGVFNRPFYHRYIVRDSLPTRIGAEETKYVVCMLYRAYQSVRCRRPNPFRDSIHPF